MSTARPVPRVSVCIPSFHGARYLPEALASVGAQTFRDWEIVVVEDGSRDGAEAIATRFARESGHPVRYVRHETNRGLPAARNTGVRQARGDVIAMLDADDLWREEHLEVGLETLDRHRADVAFSGAVEFDEASGEVLGHLEPRPEELDDLPRSLFRRCFLTTTGSLVRREAILAVGGHDEGMRYCDDLDLWLRLLRAGRRLRATGRRTCYYRRHGAAMTRSDFLMALYRALAYDKQRDWTAVPRGVRRRRCARSWWRAGVAAAGEDRWLAASCLLESARARLGLPRRGAAWPARVLARRGADRVPG